MSADLPQKCWRDVIHADWRADAESGAGRCLYCRLRDVYDGDIDMPNPVFLGEFEQLVLIAILHLENDTGVLALKERLDRIAGRSVSRGALYRTLDRLADKGWVDWSLDEEERPERGGHPCRRLAVTRPGIAVLKASRRTLLQLWKGIEKAIG
jgi:DNA-binding PadR family transcriptional regulator